LYSPRAIISSLMRRARRNFSTVAASASFGSSPSKLLLARRELAVQRQDELKKACGQIHLWMEIPRHAVDAWIWHKVSRFQPICFRARMEARSLLPHAHAELLFDISNRSSTFRTIRHGRFSRQREMARVRYIEHKFKIPAYAFERQ